MKVVGYFRSLPIDHEESLVDLELAEPDIGEHDLLLEIRAVSVNPIDAKTRIGSVPANGKSRILGFDAAGIVRKTQGRLLQTSRQATRYVSCRCDQPLGIKCGTVSC